MVIWKSVFVANSSHDDVFVVEIKAKKNAKPISVAMQGKDCCVWFEVDPAQVDAYFKLYIAGTGFGRVPVGKKFLGTLIQGAYVWHVYH